MHGSLHKRDTSRLEIRSLLEIFKLEKVAFPSCLFCLSSEDTACQSILPTTSFLYLILYKNNCSIKMRNCCIKINVVLK